MQKKPTLTNLRFLFDLGFKLKYFAGKSPAAQLYVRRGKYCVQKYELLLLLTSLMFIYQVV